MPYSAERALELLRHPGSRSGAASGVRARVRRADDGTLAVAFAIEGDAERLRVPAPRPPRFAGRLWEHTCCEVFVACKGSSAYHEFNLAPSGEWAAYAFRGYRDNAGPDATGLDPRITVGCSASVLELEATLRLDLVSSGYASAPLAIGLCAVIEDRDGALSYWALRHPPGKPDFHHTDAFALEIE